MLNIPDNYKSIVDVCENDSALIDSVIAIMLTSFPEHINKCDTALRSWETRTLGDTLHLLKGSLSYLSLNNESQKIADLEEYLQTDNESQFQQCYLELRKYLLMLPNALYEYHNKPQA